MSAHMPNKKENLICTAEDYKRFGFVSETFFAATPVAVFHGRYIYLSNLAHFSQDTYAKLVMKRIGRDR